MYNSSFRTSNICFYIKYYNNSSTATIQIFQNNMSCMILSRITGQMKKYDYDKAMHETMQDEKIKLKRLGKSSKLRQ